MTFIKIKNVVINTNYVAAIELDNQTRSGKKCVDVLIATTKFSLFPFISQAEGALQDN